MDEGIVKVIGDLFRRGYTIDGIAYVLGLLAAEHVEGSDRRRALEQAAQELKGQ